MRLLPAIALLSACQAPCGKILHEASPHILSLSGVSGETVSYTAAGRSQVTGITDGAALLTGLPPLSEVAYRVLDSDGLLVCEDAAMTWNLPSGLPQLTITENDRTRLDPDTVLVGTLIGATSLLFAIDREGRWLWHHEVEEGLIAVDLHIQDGSILHNVFESEFTTDAGEIRWQDLAGNQTASLRTEGAHHVFEPTPDGAIAWPAVDIRDWYDERRDETITIVGDRLMAPPGSCSQSGTTRTPSATTNGARRSTSKASTGPMPTASTTPPSAMPTSSRWATSTPSTRSIAPQALRCSASTPTGSPRATPRSPSSTIPTGRPTAP